MNITVAMAMTLALVGTASASNRAAGTVRICVSSGTLVSIFELTRAETISSRMFAAAGVIPEWRSAGSAACHGFQPIRIVVVDFATGMAPNVHPGAMAYAFPYEAVHVIVLFDRIEQNIASATQVSGLLAHVMTHEITHILQGTARHSESGIMKAFWDVHEISRMTYHPLPFAREDIDLIQAGMRR
jgi:hypothetical protein